MMTQALQENKYYIEIIINKAALTSIPFNSFTDCFKYLNELINFQAKSCSIKSSIFLHKNNKKNILLKQNLRYIAGKND